jgi:CelD/BcsL family acetyltransferase involved in cellulose biosynthesis
MVERHESVDPLRKEWDLLADRTDAEPWLRPGWIAAWWRAFGRGSLSILVSRRGGRLTGVLPVRARAGMRVSPANWHTPAFAPLAENEWAHAELARALLEGWTTCVDLRFLPPDDQGLRVCRAAARATRWRVVERTIRTSPYLDLRDGWDDYAATKRHALRDIRRRRRRLEERGEVILDVSDGGDALDALLDDGFRIEGSGWKSARGTAITSRPETDRFYRDVARWTAERGWLQLAFLRVDGRAVAFNLNVVAAGVHYHLKGGYDPQYARYSPGRLLHRELIERAFRHRLHRYEFLGAPDPWKLQWTTTTHDRRRLQAFPPTPAGLAAFAAISHLRPLALRALGKAR